MFCKNCGTVLADDASFCKECGCKAEGGAQQQEQRQEGQSTAEKGEEVRKEEPTRERRGNIGHRLLSVLLSILVVLLVTGASMIFLLRYMVSEDVIDNAIKGLDISEAKLCFIEEGDLSSPTIAELIRSCIEPGWRQFLTDDGLKQLLGEKFVRRFVSNKVNDYVEDLLNNTGEGVIDAKEVEKLLEQNRDTIYNDTTFIIRDGEARLLVPQLEDILDKSDLSLYRDENPQIFLLIRCFASYWMAALFLFLAVLLLAGTIALQDKKPRGLIYLSIDLILVGVFNFVAVGMTNSLTSLLNRTIGLGRNFWRTLLNPVKGMGIKQGAILVAVGVVLSLVYILVNTISKKKHNAGIKMHA